MKVRSSIQARCAACRQLKRRGRLYIICSAKPSHKQKQG